MSFPVVSDPRFFTTMQSTNPSLAQSSPTHPSIRLLPSSSSDSSFVSQSRANTTSPPHDYGSDIQSGIGLSRVSTTRRHDAHVSANNHLINQVDSFISRTLIVLNLMTFLDTSVRSILTLDPGIAT